MFAHLAALTALIISWSSPPPSYPRQLAIPAIGLTANITAAGLGPDRLQVVPDSPAEVSWFSPGSLPGEIGSAVLAGHNQWLNNPGVFASLHRVNQGDTLLVTSGTQTRRFVVDSIQAYPVADFPTRQIYARSDSPRLNLVTCHGRFDPRTQDYSHRLVVSAHPVLPSALAQSD